MSEARLPSHVLVSALMRQVSEAGGSAMLRARGDADGGVILVLASERGGETRVYERGIGAQGEPVLIDSTPADSGGDLVEDYWRRRRSRDPDLWVIELDVVHAERFAAETLIGR